MYPDIKTLRHLLDDLKTIQEEEPNALDLPLIYSMDEEGNSFGYVFFNANLAHYYEDEGTALFDDSKKPNAICIN